MTSIPPPPAFLAPALSRLRARLGDARLVADNASRFLAGLSFPGLPLATEAEAALLQAPLIAVSFVEPAALTQRLRRRCPQSQVLDLMHDVLPALMLDGEIDAGLAPAPTRKGIILLGDDALALYARLGQREGIPPAFVLEPLDVLRPAVLGHAGAETLIARCLAIAGSRGGLGVLGIGDALLAALTDARDVLFAGDATEMLAQHVALLVGDPRRLGVPVPRGVAVCPHGTDAQALLALIDAARAEPSTPPARAEPTSQRGGQMVTAMTNGQPGRQFLASELVELAELEWSSTPQHDGSLWLAPEGGNLLLRSIRNVMEQGFVLLRLRPLDAAGSLHITINQGETARLPWNSASIALAIALPPRRALPIRLDIRGESAMRGIMVTGFAWQPAPPELQAVTITLDHQVLAWHEE